MTDKYLDRFFSYIEIDGECWSWTGGLKGAGYAFFYNGIKQVGGHRYAYEKFVAEIPDDHVIDHLCKNKRCVNPYHLEAVTQAENIRRGDAPSVALGLRNHCNNGHLFSEQNTIKRKDNGRRCRTCQRNYYAMHKST